MFELFEETVKVGKSQMYEVNPQSISKGKDTILCVIDRREPK